MPGYSAKLPLVSLEAGYGLNKTVEATVKQNLKMLLLTTPGERVMLPDFGAGLIKYLFELDNPLLRGNIEATIRSQDDRWLPFIEIFKFTFNSASDNSEVQENLLSIRLEYRISPLQKEDILLITAPEIPI